MEADVGVSSLGVKNVIFFFFLFIDLMELGVADEEIKFRYFLIGKNIRGKNV